MDESESSKATGEATTRLAKSAMVDANAMVNFMVKRVFVRRTEDENVWNNDWTSAGGLVSPPIPLYSIYTLSTIVFITFSSESPC